MAIYARIFRESPISLWGLSSRQRLERMLAKAGVAMLQEPSYGVDAADSVLLLRADFLYDPRIIQGMIRNLGVVLQAKPLHGSRPVAAHVPVTQADLTERVLSGEGAGELPGGLRRETPETIAVGYLKELRKFDVPYLLPISAENRRHLENRLFAGSYKGVTDLVTKWLWPVPAQWGTRLCTRLGIVPNHVTSLSLVLSVLAGFLFYHGQYAVGLLAAWLMTFLDTVDGKLARVTVNYSAFGNIFDHAIDLVFPPLWYLAWGFSLAIVPGMSLSSALWLVLGGYVAGRLVEGIFKQWLESSGIFCWRPIDSCFRLITGRRNPNLVLLTIGLLFGRPDLGFVAVCLWTALSSLFLVVRLLMGLYLRLTTGPLRSWFLDIDPEAGSLSVAQRWFCHRPPAEDAG